MKKGKNIKYWWASLTTEQRTEAAKIRARGRKAKGGPWHSPETIAKMKANHKGSTGKHWTLSEETRKRQSMAQSKENNPAWRGGLTEKNWGFYGMPEYREWRKKVLERDGKKCVWCGSKDRLEADHIAPRFLYPELRFSIENGRTLCHSCHEKTDTYRGKNRFVKSNNLFQRSVSQN